MKLFLAVTFLFLANNFHSEVEADQLYKDKDNWAATLETCGGERQSPINIKTNETEEEELGVLVFDGYDKTPSEGSLINNGHSLKLGVSESTDLMQVSKGGLNDTYKLAQLHFHWGSNDMQGSEHTINGKQYPLEVHMVHYNSKYDSLKDSLIHDDGLAVVGVFFEVGDSANANLKKLLSHISDGDIAEFTHDLTSKDLFPIGNLFPTSKGFYRYQGSLTTPTCNQIVTWTVFKHTLPVSSAQLTQFRSLMDTSGNIIQDNFRSTQDLNGRKVLYSHGSIHTTSLILMLMCVIKAFF